MLRWIYVLTYCEYGGEHYIVDCGPIGLSVVGEVAMKSKNNEFPELNEWPWYVDDSVLECKRNTS